MPTGGPYRFGSRLRLGAQARLRGSVSKSRKNWDANRRRLGIGQNLPPVEPLPRDRATAADTMPLTPEQQARRDIDTDLGAAGWIVQPAKDMDLSAGRGVAVC